MAIRLFLALAALIGLMWFFGWYGKADPATRNNALKTILLYGIGGVILLLVVTGRIPWLFALISAAVPILQRLLVAKQTWGLFKSLRSTKSGQSSGVSAAWLEMALDHDTGEMDGRILQGKFQDKRLSQLSRDQLMELLAECQEEPQSTQLIEAYLDRTSPGWRPEPGQTADNDGGQDVSIAEAYEILGLDSGANREQIVTAHRRLVQKLHPDRGGSSYLAARINKAKDMLLEHLG